MKTLPAQILKLWEQKKKGPTTPCINRKMIPRHQHLCFSGNSHETYPQVFTWWPEGQDHGNWESNREGGKPAQGCVIKMC